MDKRETDQTKREPILKENANEKKDIISDTVKNAHASGDGSIKRSENSITESMEDKANTESSSEQY